MKIESHKRLDEREKNAKEEFQKKVVTVEQVHSQKDKAHLAMEAQKAANKENRDIINKEISEALQRKKEEEEFEMARKTELIR